MSGRRVVVYIAVSLDGCIAGPDGDLSWLVTEGEWGFDAFFSGVDTLLMGRVTYEVSAGFDPWPYTGRRCIVFGRDLPADPRIEPARTDVVRTLQALRAQPGADVWIVGGAGIVRDAWNAGLVDRLVLGVHPVVLGAGTPLFAPGVARRDLTLVSTVAGPAGLLVTTYDVTTSA